MNSSVIKKSESDTNLVVLNGAKKYFWVKSCKDDHLVTRIEGQTHDNSKAVRVKKRQHI